MKWTLPAAIALALWAVQPALAHHSFAMFDRTKTVEVTGTVKEFQWTNPHNWIQVMVPDSAGKPVEWGFESGSPRTMGGHGWTRKSLKAGDRVKLTYNPLRAGGNGGAFVSLTLPDGTTLYNSAPQRE